MLLRKYSRAFLAAAAVLGAAFGLHRAAASQGERRGGREPWNHCAVVVSGTVLTEGASRSGVASVCYFRGGRSDCEEVRVPFAQVGERFSTEAVQMQTASSVISRLGYEGWQLVDVAPAVAFGMSGGGQAFYFKRPN